MGPPRQRYLIRALVSASGVLKSFQHPGEVLRLRDVVARTGFDKGTAYRLLYTLHYCGLVEKVGTKEYRSAIRISKPVRYRFGYAADGQNCSFTRDVTDGLVRAAKEENIELVVANQKYASAKAALRAVDELIRDGVDLLIERQTDSNVAPVISARCLAASIPMIGVEVPHPGATYFGANNYEAGLIGGRYLAKWAQANWNSQVDEIILIEQRRAGPLPCSRVMGILAGIEEVLPAAAASRLVQLDGDSELGQSLVVIRKHLRFSTAKHVLVGAMDDPSAIGALRAFEEAGRLSNCSVMSHNASLEGRAELRRPGSRLIGSVGYFPEKYGEALIKIGLEIVGKKPVPSAVFVRHRLVTRQNVNQFYPNDALLSAAV